MNDVEVGALLHALLFCFEAGTGNGICGNMFWLRFVVWERFVIALVEVG